MEEVLLVEEVVLALRKHEPFAFSLVEVEVRILPLRQLHTLELDVQQALDGWLSLALELELVHHDRMVAPPASFLPACAS